MQEYSQDDIRNHPRFEDLVEQYGSQIPQGAATLLSPSTPTGKAAIESWHNRFHADLSAPAAPSDSPVQQRSCEDDAHPHIFAYACLVFLLIFVLFQYLAAAQRQAQRAPLQPSSVNLHPSK